MLDDLTLDQFPIVADLTFDDVLMLDDEGSPILYAGSAGAC